MSPIIEISIPQLLLALLFILVAQTTSFIQKLGLNNDITIGTIRTVAQLFLMGYALTFIFGANNPWLTVGIFIVMVFSAIFIVRGRVKEKQIAYEVPTFTRSSSCSCLSAPRP